MIEKIFIRGVGFRLQYYKQSLYICTMPLKISNHSQKSN